MMHRRLTFIVSLALGVAAFGAQAADTASALQDFIAREGATRVVRRLDSGDGRRWGAVLRHVQGGQAPWLAAAIRLKPGTDGATAEGLSAAVATALLSNPGNVLRLMSPAYGVQRICIVPMIEPAPEAVATYRAKAAIALATVSSPKLTALVQQCRTLLLKH
jgi:hypothetical protein